MNEDSVEGRGRRFWGLPLLLPTLVATALCYFLRSPTQKEDKPSEFYPLSSFPMYSKFDPRTYYVYLRDPNGHPMASVAALNAVTSGLKKDYGRQLGELDDDHEGSHFDWPQEVRAKAGAAVIAYWMERYPDRFADGRMDGTELVDVRITLGSNREVLRSEEVVGVFKTTPE